MEILCCGPTVVGVGGRDRNLTFDLPTTTTITMAMKTPGKNLAKTDKPAGFTPPLPSAWRLTWPLLVKVVLSNRK